MSSSVTLEPSGLWLRLAIALVLALGLYLVAMPQTAVILVAYSGSPRVGTDKPTATTKRDDLDDADTPQPTLELGRLEAPPVQTIAWIGHDDFEELVAKQRRVTQAAQQDDADPTPDAPRDVLNPTPPSPASPPTPPIIVTRPPIPTTPTTPQPEAAPRPPTPPAPLIAEVPPPPTGDVAVTTPNPPPTPQPSPPETPNPDPQPNPAPPTTEPPDPTAAPRTDAESPPVTIRYTDLQKRANGVFVGQGFELITKRPERVNSAIFAARGVAVFDIHFNRNGRVDRVVTLQSSGYADIDEALINSVYRYRLRGDILEDSDQIIIEQFGIGY
ncbi:MAG: hypothetical protein AAF797_04775 [Planctomycetota bacterium]